MISRGTTLIPLLWGAFRRRDGRLAWVTGGAARRSVLGVLSGQQMVMS